MNIELVNRARILSRLLIATLSAVPVSALASPVETVEALTPFLDAMGRETSKSRLADASTAAVTELVRSLKENHAASNDLWEDATEAALSFVNEPS